MKEIATRSAVAIAYAGVCFLIAGWVNKHVVEPYMDEPFHVPQTQRYCSGDFATWDPKITTLPGLYLFGVLCARFQQLLFHMPDLAEACNTQSLRNLNIILAAICLVLFYQTHHAVHSTTHPTKPSSSWLVALTLATYPLHFFYTFLYYTDVGSTLFVLLCYLLTLHRRFLPAALAGAIAVLFRQTNAVWVTFILASAIMIHLQPASPSQPTTQKPTKSPPTLLTETTTLLHSLWTHKLQLLTTFLPLLLVPIAFTAFILINGGITVGDRQAHTPVRHFMQLQYFAAFTSAISFPIFYSPTAFRSAASTLLHHRHKPLLPVLIAAVTVACSVLAVRYSTLVHPYLVADNRHYTFYIWRKWFARHCSCRYLAVPVYLYSWAEIARQLRGTCSKLWVLAYTVCCAATLVPAWLLEFRYFTIPYMLLMLHIPPPTKLQLTTSILVNVLVNVATLYMFVQRPYTWADGSIARFMW